MFDFYNKERGYEKMKLRNEIYNEQTRYVFIDPDLPREPRLEIYEETFGDLKNITEKWYKKYRA